MTHNDNDVICYMLCMLHCYELQSQQFSMLLLTALHTAATTTKHVTRNKY